MPLKLRENEQKILWTKHVRRKMRQYQLSERRLKRILRRPIRKEKGIAPRTIAVMQPAGTRKHPTEIWLMYQALKSKVRIISAWRYPGISPTGEPIPIPEDILEELNNILKKE